MLTNEDLKYTLAAVSGTISQTITNCKNKRLVFLYVKSATATTEFDVSIVEKNSETIYSATGNVGKLVDTANLPQYTYGNFTLTISNATVDENFTVIIIFNEELY